MSAVVWGLRTGPIPPAGTGSGGGSPAMLCSGGRRWPSSGRGRARAREKKWNSIAIGACSRMGACGVRCGNGWCAGFRCQIHKCKNVVEHLPEGCRADWKRRLRNAYAMTSYAEAKAALEKLWRQLCEINPSAARSLEEGMEETLTVHRLGMGSLLRRTLSSTNAIESCLSRCLSARSKTELTGPIVEDPLVAQWESAFPRPSRL